jgi:hypothetical protein
MVNQPNTGGGPVPSAVTYLRWSLFAILLLASAAALIGLPRAEAGAWSTWLRLVPVMLLVLFVGGYATYRFTLVRAGHYSAGKALVRVGALVLLTGAIAGIALDRPTGPPRTVVGLDLAPALAGADPVARALAAEVARHRPRAEALGHIPRLIELLDDPSPLVRAEAQATLVALAGHGVGDPPGLAERWRQHWTAAGVKSAP